MKQGWFWKAGRLRQSGIKPDAALVYRNRQRLGNRTIGGGLGLVVQSIVGIQFLHKLGANLSAKLANPDLTLLNDAIYVEIALIPIGILWALWGYKILRTNTSTDNGNASRL